MTGGSKRRRSSALRLTFDASNVAYPQHPFIDAKNGGSVQGLIRALNAILDLTVFRHHGEGATLAQIQASRVTANYDTRSGANTGPWTTAMFVQVVYDTLAVRPDAR